MGEIIDTNCGCLEQDCESECQMAGSIEPSQISTGTVTAWICAGVVIVLIMVAVIWKKASNLRRGLKSDNDDRKNGRINNQRDDVELYTPPKYVCIRMAE